ncbi:hypothetical protein LARV_01475 [Longilinea arvoryzae]|uniref:Uncharacterized protein n=1 Tax=Longilinea arvoryzae TaxID=360412 RepID=A0A0S7BHK5_9CHLR|nr:hypothetical protein [Longilinea arvoryzae]GAP13720.1 hypothetical protein LARV_01475 [Longilinea arvoryzae]
MKPRIGFHGSIFWTALALILILQSCTSPSSESTQAGQSPPAATNTPTRSIPGRTPLPSSTPRPSETPLAPTQVAVITPDSQVRRLNPAVFAGQGQPLPEVASDSAIALEPGGLVTTDAQGEAEVLIQGCLKLFIFQEVTLQRSTCRRSDTESGLAVCSVGGMTGVLNQCANQVDIQTPGSSTQTKGTWFAVIYLPADQLSIVQVYEGAVDVSAAIDPSAGQWTSGSRLEAGNLWFTAPGADAPVINGIQGRQAQPMEVWQALRPELIDKYPNLDKWMRAARQRAGQEDLAFPDFLAPPAGEVHSQFIGQVWRDERIQKAMLVGVDWKGIVRNSWFDYDITPSLQILGYTIPDARIYPYNRDDALSLLSEANYWQNAVTISIVAHETDPAGGQFANSLQSALFDLDINSEVLQVSDAQFEELRNLDPTVDSPFILVSSSGEAFGSASPAN